MGVFRVRFGCFSFGFYRRLTGSTVGPGSQTSLLGSEGGAAPAGGHRLCQSKPSHLLRGHVPLDWLKLKQIKHLAL